MSSCCDRLYTQLALERCAHTKAGGLPLYDTLNTVQKLVVQESGRSITDVGAALSAQYMYGTGCSWYAASVSLQLCTSSISVEYPQSRHCSNISEHSSVLVAFTKTFVCTTLYLTVLYMEHMYMPHLKMKGWQHMLHNDAGSPILQLHR